MSCGDCLGGVVLGCQRSRDGGGGDDDGGRGGDHGDGSVGSGYGRSSNDAHGNDNGGRNGDNGGGGCKEDGHNKVVVATWQWKWCEYI